MKNSLATFCFISPAVLLMLLFFIFPFVWMVITSFKPENEIFSNAFHFFSTKFYPN